MTFQHWQNLNTRIESLLERDLSQGKTSFHVVGANPVLTSSLLLSQSLSKDLSDLPRLVIVSSLDQALLLKEQVEFFTPHLKSYILRHYDVSPFSGLMPSPEVRNSRIEFLYWAAKAQKNDIFIVPVAALLQLSTPFKNFQSRCHKLLVGSEVPEDLAVYFNSLGYQSTPVVEDVGQYSLRGGIVDIYSPAEKAPMRLELFGDQIESMRSFSIADQRSLDEKRELHLAPVYEVELNDDTVEHIIENLRIEFTARGVTPTESDETLRSISFKNYFLGSELLLPYCYDQLSSVLDHFNSDLHFYFLDVAEISRVADEHWQEIETDYQQNIKNTSVVFCPPPARIVQKYENVSWPQNNIRFQFSNLSFLDEILPNEARVEYLSQPLTEFTLLAQNMTAGSDAWLKAAGPKITGWLHSGYKIFVSTKNPTQLERIKSLLQRLELNFDVAAENEYLWQDWFDQSEVITLLHEPSAVTGLLNEEKIIFLRSDDFFGNKQARKTQTSYDEFASKAKSLAFGDLKPNDMVVHVKHGIGLYEGLKIMNIGGVESEYIQVAYKDKDKLYLPVYRVGQLQKFSGGAHTNALDKLGGLGWEKTKIKVKSHLRDIAAELLQLYAKRSEIERPAVGFDDIANAQFERGFPFEETIDQLKAIRDIQKDFSSNKPMDRLVCGDVGFGKTEVAMRAAFQAVSAGKQVAVLAPTTVLTFQHLETFKKRFTGLNYNIRSLNRFVSPADQKVTLKELKEGKVDILIGTHRLLSKDVVFKDMGLLVIDEEQKFGVTHKEKIKKMRIDVDTLTLSATPIPRTLNMSFTGLRDLSIINTAPVDRVPTRTFISKFDKELIRKGIQSEIARGGQVYFIHNRVQSIYGVADEIRQILPGARLRIAHGQMNEEELEGAMLAFFHHEIDVLVCTAIVESGMDVPRANTMFIDQAHMFGLSQLYQLRGRVGRSKARAFCYLLLPRDKKIEKDAQERLKIIQDNSALGSGIRIAQYDLELRGAGNILGDDQSGHVNSVGYELYMDLLNEALAEAKGEDLPDRDLDPEINLRVPALIPDAYISDIRIRLSYYKALSDVSSNEEMDRIESELRDQFGPLPEPVVNLMGLMLIRKQCKDLGVRDISAGAKNISLIFTERTRLKPETAIQLAMRENKKYSITPDQRLNIRMNSITWSNVYEELTYLLTLI